MSAQDFQPGDRVEYVGHTSDLKGRTGTVSGQPSPFTVFVDFDGESLAQHGVIPGNLKKLDPKPEIRVGDRVRLSVEGVAKETGEFLVLDGVLPHASLVIGYPDHYDVEILERKVEPLEPGTVVRDKTGATYVVTHDGSARFVKEDGSLAHHAMFSAEYWARAVASPTDSLRILE